MKFWKRPQPAAAPAPVTPPEPAPVMPPEPAPGTPPAYARLLPRSLFNAAAYLAHNPDVAAAVASRHTTAYGHYVQYGYLEEARGDRPQSIPTQAPSISTRALADEAILDRLIEAEITNRTLLAAWDRQLPSIPKISFDMLSEEVDDATQPPLNRADCNEKLLDADQLQWRRQGYVIKKSFIPDDLLDRYAAVRALHPSKGGWSCPTPYMHIAELRDVSLYPPLMQLMERLVGEEMGLHLNLTGWVSTERNWHQDDYLNPPYINSWYAAVWIALDDIHPDCGPFEFVPGSHQWPLLRSHKVRMFLNPEERASDNWPATAERFVNDAAAEEIARRGVEPQKFIAKKGDVLIWHGRLMHRGSYPNVPGMERRTLISHYSGISHRIDMPLLDRTPEGAAYFLHTTPIDFDPYAVAAE